MAATLQVSQHHYATQVADVQAVCRWVDTDVGRDLFFLQ
jgi:hypothetical protein